MEPKLFRDLSSGASGQLDVALHGGRKSEGGFCSLDCYASFYQLELTERARRLVERTKRKES
jgi:hypothetical protein